MRSRGKVRVRSVADIRRDAAEADRIREAQRMPPERRSLWRDAKRLALMFIGGGIFGG